MASTGKLVKTDIVINTLLIFETSKQHTWMVTTTSKTYILLDDEHTRASKRLIQASFDKAKTLPLEVRNASRFKGLRVVKFAAQETWWYYSAKLFPTKKAFTSAVQKLISNPQP